MRSVCLKSHERSNRVLPNSLSMFFISFNVLFNASSECLCAIMLSSQMIILHCFSTVAMDDFCLCCTLRLSYFKYLVAVYILNELFCFYPIKMQQPMRCHYLTVFRRE
uniref:Uncharacterized protein n=1 Tax=Sipha flava TaxID=143950 RepID=A0A2S2QFJ4_9HEMI